MKYIALLLEANSLHHIHTYDQRKQTIKLLCKQEHVKYMEWYVFMTELIEDLKIVKYIYRLFIKATVII